eukprot:6126896-Amphidinium_carterae.1
MPCVRIYADLAMVTEQQQSSLDTLESNLADVASDVDRGYDTDKPSQTNLAILPECHWEKEIGTDNMHRFRTERWNINNMLQRPTKLFNLVVLVLLLAEDVLSLWRLCAISSQSFVMSASMLDDALWQS